MASIMVENAVGATPSKSLHPPVPLVELRYEGLCYSIKQTSQQARSDIPTVAGAILNTFIGPPKAIARRLASIGSKQEPAPVQLDFRVLENVSGRIRPGTMTLVLSPPGHGKSAFLKALTQMLPPKDLKGTITYSGLTPVQAASAGIHLGSIAQYVNQIDEHLAQLTVRETLDFIRANAAVDPSLHGYPHLAAAHADAVPDMIRLLHLEGCQTTVIGNELLRGVSGGEKKRVTVGEGLLTAARLLALDEISTGLDSAVTYDIVKRLRSRASEQGLTVITSLLQPTPETYALFDEVVLLREGGVVYHGPRTALPAYLASLGFKPPVEVIHHTSGTGEVGDEEHVSPKLSAASREAGDHMSQDIADWLVQLLTNPTKLVAMQARSDAGLSASASASGMDAMADLPAPVLKVVAAPQGTMPLTTPELTAAWRSSSLFAEQMGSPVTTPTLHLEGTYALQQYSRGYAHSFVHHTALLLGRQGKLMTRNLLYVRSRIMSACVMSIILGGLYYQRQTAEGMTFYGTFLNACMTMGFANLSEMAAAVENKYIAYRHVANGAYPGPAFVAAGAIAHLPVAAAECLIFTGVLYGMTGMGPDAGRYFFFFLVVFLFDCVMRNLLTLFAFNGKTLQAAQAAPLPVIALMIIFGGFLIVRGKMGWLEFVSYINPIAWALRSLSVNEFTMDKYSIPVRGTSSTLGQLYLRAFDMPESDTWKWGGVIFLAGFLFFILMLTFRSFSNVRFDRNIGSSRKQVDAVSVIPEPNSATVTPSPTASENNPALPSPSAPGEQSYSNPMHPEALAVTVHALHDTAASQSALPFQPMSVTFADITYTVQLPAHMGGGSRTLLRGISGCALPGRMLGLMGASGAGKTTLLDVLGGRKNTGVQSGEITLNGFPKESSTFNRVTAYVEQQDIHMPLDTVKEALLFSAAMRLPSSVTTAQREQFVREVLALLELTDIADRKVGAVGAPDGLAPHERKRLTIGVELVSNAPVLFLDEPTSGLDARAAAIVMRVVKNVANTGRTIICTIHQPSAELFFMFDDLLLLARGGYQVYFGELGYKGRSLVAYLSSIPGLPDYPMGMNPASWMLDALQGMASQGGDTLAAGEKAAPSVPQGENLQAFLLQSKAWVKAKAILEDKSSPEVGASKVSFASSYAISVAAQTAALVHRQLRSHSRNIPLNYFRWLALCMLSLMFGTIWFDIYGKATDVGGVQSLVSAIFMGSAFVAMVNMNVVVPAFLTTRAVFYREQASSMYDPIGYSMGWLVAEIPAITFCVLSAQSIQYFMFKLVSTAAAFFFHVLVTLTLALVYVSMGMTVAAYVPTFEVAQAILGLLGPLFFLFGGLWSPPAQMAIGARWFCYIDPITYAFRALIPQQFKCAEGTTCTLIDQITPLGLVRLDRYDYVSTKYDVHFDDMYVSVGYLCLFVLAFQFMAIMAVRYVRRISR